MSAAAQPVLPKGPYPDLEACLDALRGLILRMGALSPGATIGVAPREAIEERGSVLLWEAAQAGGGFRYRSFQDWGSLPADICFVADAAARSAFAAAGPADLSAWLRTMLRRGHVLFYSISPEPTLEEKGFRDFLEEYGIGFMGACR